MSKLFNKYYKVYMKQSYSKEDYLPLLSLKNHTSRFVAKATPLPTSGVEYKIHVKKRIKPKTTTLEPTTASNFALLDNLSLLDWDTKLVTVNDAHTLGIRSTEVGDNVFLGEDANVFKRQIEESIEAIQILRMENVIETLLSNNPTSKVASTSDVWGTIAKDIELVASTSDDYIHGESRDKLMVWINPFYSLYVAKEKGITFRNEAPIYGVGVKAQESINGVPLFRNRKLGAFKVGTKQVAYIVFSLNAIYFDYYKTYFQFDGGMVKFMGYYFFDLLLQVFKNRIRIGTFDGPTLSKVKA